METNRIITGTVTIAGRTEQITTAATLQINLLDLTETDTAARLVAQARLQPDWKRVSAGEAIPFRLVADGLEKDRSYGLSAVISVRTDGQLAPGDFITMESYPVPVGQSVAYQLTLKPV